MILYLSSAVIYKMQTFLEVWIFRSDWASPVIMSPKTFLIHQGSSFHSALSSDKVHFFRCNSYCQVFMSALVIYGVIK